MSICPNCGYDTKDARKLVKASAKELVEALRVEDFIEWFNVNMPVRIDLIAELEDFKLRMRANGYKVGRNAVKDARAAFQYHLRNAVKFSRRGKPQAERVAPTPRKEL